MERPPGLVFHALFVIICLRTLVYASLPGWDGLGKYFALIAWLVAGFLWSGWLAAYEFLHFRRRVTLIRHSRRGWLFVPLCAALTLTLLFFHVPLRVRFALSRAALEREARVAKPATTTSTSGEEPWQAQGIGLFPVVRSEAVSGVVSFQVEGAGPDSGCSGFAYSPAGPPAGLPGLVYDSIGDGWYAWSRYD